MLKPRLLILAMLLATSAHAGLGPERFFTGLGTSSQWRVVFDGTNYVAVWSETAGTFAARIDEKGDPVGDRIQLSPRPTAVNVATDRGVTLVAWMEPKPDGGDDVLARWLDLSEPSGHVIAHRVAPPFYDQGPPLSIDIAVTEGKFLIAYRGADRDWIEVLGFQPHGLTPVISTRVSAPASAEVAIAATDSSLLFAWGRMVLGPIGGPPGCCYEPRPVAMATTTSANPTSLPVMLENGRDFGLDIGAAPWGDFVVSLGHDEWSGFPATLAMVSGDGQVRDRVRFPLMIMPGTASFGKTVFLTLRTNQRIGVGTLFLSGIDGRQNSGDWGFYRMSTSTLVNHSKLTAGSSTLLASYELVGPAGQRGIAYQIIDPTSLPPLPARPASTRIESSIAGVTAQTTVAWEPVPSAERYRIQLEMVNVYSSEIERVLDDPNASRVVVSLSPDVEYRIVVFAENANGRSHPSDVISFRAPAFGIPRSPSFTRAFRNSDGTLTVAWTDNSTNEDGFRVVVYGSQGATVLADVPPNSDRVTIPQPAGTPFSYVYIYAYNASGYSQSGPTNVLVSPRSHSVHH